LRTEKEEPQSTTSGMRVRESRFARIIETRVLAHVERMQRLLGLHEQMMRTPR
jgi:hypothetical protein